jgi:hypothetical protein
MANDTRDASGDPRPADKASEAILPFGDRLDEIAQGRFNRTDWIELAAAVLLALATIVAAWSAYQATRWGGVQANAFSAAGAARTEATQQNSLYTAGLQIDVLVWIEYLKAREARDVLAVSFFEDRLRPEFRPALDAWLAQVPEGELPPGTPFGLDAYQPDAEQQALELNTRAEALAEEARKANQTGDNFVLVAVIMASVLFFAGVGTKLKGRGVRLMMLSFGALLFLGGLTFMLSMPQNVGI